MVSMTNELYSGRSAFLARLSLGPNRYAFSTICPVFIRCWTAMRACNFFPWLRTSSSRTKTWLWSSSLRTESTSMRLTSPSR